MLLPASTHGSMWVWKITFLGRLHASLFVSVTRLRKLCSLECVCEAMRKLANQNGRGERTQILRLPRGFQVFQILYGHNKRNGNVDINIAPEPTCINPGLLHTLFCTT